MSRPALTHDELTCMRERILDEAAQIVARDGYLGLSMRRLAQGLDLSAGALYRYFPTKQHVLNAYWASALEDLHRRFGEADRPGREPILVVRDAFLAYADFALSDHDRFRLMFLENDLGAMEAFSQRSETFAGYRFVRAKVQDAIDDGSIAGSSADEAMQILWGAVHGVLTLMMTVKEIDFGDVRGLSVRAVDIVLRGLRP